MAGDKSEIKSITVPWVAAAPRRGETLVMVTAYDCPQGRTADAAGVDIVLVGDSLAMVVLGHPDTLSVTLEEMIHHTKAVRRGVKRALLVVDTRFMNFPGRQQDFDELLHRLARPIKGTEYFQPLGSR